MTKVRKQPSVVAVVRETPRPAKPKRIVLTERKKREMLLMHQEAIAGHAHRIGVLEQKNQSWWNRLFS